MVEIRVPGREDDVAATAARPSPDLGVKVEVKHSVRVAAVRGAAEAVTVSAAPDDIVELRMDGGAVLWIRADEVRERLGTPLSRGDNGAVVIDPAIPVDDRSRGLGAWTIEALQVLGIDLAGKAARDIAEAFEAKAVPEPGLRTWTGTVLAPFVPGDAGDKPWLLFLHGTASNTTAGFGDLPTLQQGAWSALRATYGERILALEHRTLTLSPIANALALVNALPAGIELHVVSHSRGGLVGELLGRGRLTDASGARRPPFDEIDLKLFDNPAFADQRKDLVELNEVLARKQIRVTRFVRVACPARGTSLLGGRIDRWLNLVFDVASLALGGRLNPVTSELLDGLRALVQATVKERTDPATLPGLAAMSPEFSPLLRVLNRQDILQDDGLQVVAGDIEPTEILQRLAIWFTDLYFGREHDLVVDTASMDGGAPRATPPRVFSDRGAVVSHFNYFANTSSVQVLGTALAPAATTPAVAAELGRAAQRPMPVLSTRGAGQLPIVFVVPGISGSHLRIGDERIWIRILELATGGVGKLDIGNTQVEADEPVGLYYGELCRFLDATHEVRPWAFDWRRSVLETARRFAQDLNAALATSPRPVRIVAHSMGGLVARTAFAQDAGLWQRFKERDGSRLVMLGTPNGGSFSVPMMLLGRNRLMQYLAMLDVTANASDQLRVVAGWPGALQMLPASHADLLETAGWTKLDRADPGLGWTIPAAGTLTEARLFREVFDKAPLDATRMFYVAGQADTFSGIQVDPKAPAGRRISFTVTPEGDGQVLWATGIPPQLKTWYAPAAHGDLARHAPAFPAILDILQGGTTERLTIRPPVVARSRGMPEALTREPVPVVPSEEQLLAAAVGGVAAPVAAASRGEVAVTIVHGDLAFATYPVVVGHYLGDSLNGTERELDRRLGGRISERRKLGLHPGQIETCQVHLDAKARPPGGVIVGLGEISDLAAGTLQRTLRRGLLALGAALNERDDRGDATERAAAGLRPRGVSCVLVGSGEGVVAVTDSVTAIMRAVRQANLLLGSRGFTRLEIVELVEQQAINAWHAVRLRSGRPEFKDGFALPGEVRRAKGWVRRIGPDADPSWWTPVTITAASDDGSDATVLSSSIRRTLKPDRRPLKYVAIAGRARAEASLVANRRSFVDRYVARITQSRVETGAGSASRTLFELLWPNRLKEQSLDDRNIRLILDESSASLPWEMMDDRRPWHADGDGEFDSDQGRGPPVVRHGVIRQLISHRFREGVASPGIRRRALVIGDPRGEASSLPELLGAQREAAEVQALLEASGYEVTALIGKSAKPEHVVSALFAQAWQIVHVAAHGVVDHIFESEGPAEPGDPPGEARTGIVLGTGMVLDAELLEQMPVPPELFVLNCCLLGTIDPTKENGYLLADRPALAASVALQLIRMGVRAVVAAGWEVNDDAAARFAHVFYDELLKGQGLGEVARLGRAAVFEEFPGSSTWGAYQVYGQPDFRLPSVAAMHRHSASQPVFAAPAEAEASIRRIAALGEVGGDRDRDADLRELRRTEDAVAAQGWLSRAELRSALAEAFAQLGDFDSAIRHYSAAALAEEATMPVRAIEQRLNLLARVAAARPKAQDPMAEDTALAEIRGSITALTRLMEACGETLERWSLVGSSWKRLARRTSGDDRMTALTQMTRAYRKARKLGQAQGVAGIFYPWSQELIGEAVLGLRAGRPIRLDTSALRSALSTAGNADFWALILPADLDLLEQVANGTFTADEQDAVAEAYVGIWNHVGTEREMASVLEQMRFLTDMLDDLGLAPGDGRTALLAGLNAVRQRLEQGTQE